MMMYDHDLLCFGAKDINVMTWRYSYCRTKDSGARDDVYYFVHTEAMAGKKDRQWPADPETEGHEERLKQRIYRHISALAE